MKGRIIGRKEEIKRLQEHVVDSKSEFIAIYGRRRVSKTFLVKELFEGQLCFRMTGIEGATTQELLQENLSNKQDKTRFL